MVVLLLDNSVVKKAVVVVLTICPSSTYCPLELVQYRVLAHVEFSGIVAVE